jgi:hypothetical protein
MSEFPILSNTTSGKTSTGTTLTNEQIQLPHAGVVAT